MSHPWGAQQSGILWKGEHHFGERLPGTGTTSVGLKTQDVVLPPGAGPYSPFGGPLTSQQRRDNPCVNHEVCNSPMCVRVPAGTKYEVLERRDDGSVKIRVDL
jgi:hypothetical protein